MENKKSTEAKGDTIMNKEDFAAPLEKHPPESDGHLRCAA